MFSRIPKSVLIGVKLVIAAILLWLTFRNVDGGEFMAAAREVKWVYLFGAFALQIVAYLFGSLRWWSMLAHSEPNVRFAAIQRPYYLGLFFNQFLPSSVGGDAVRIASLYKQGVTARSLVSSSLMDRIIGLIVLLWLGLVALNYSDVIDFPQSIRQGILACALLIPLAGISLFMPVTEKILRKCLPKNRFQRITALLFNVLGTCRSYGKSPKLIGVLLLTSLLLQVSATAVYFVLGIGLGIDIHLFAYIAIISVVYISASLPISLGGLGVRENIFVSLMVLVGVSKAEAAALAVLFLIVLWISVLPGLFFFLQGRRHQSDQKDQLAGTAESTSSTALAIETTSGIAS
jgi:uncharacterized protein (TIRG00374 family)